MRTYAISLLLFLAVDSPAQPGVSDLTYTVGVSPVVENSAAARSRAVVELTQGFNALGGNASAYRRSMSAGDGRAFDAVMLDLMGALMALPGISRRDSHGAAIAPSGSRPDRIPQIVPDLEGLKAFFQRLSAASRSDADRKMFNRARKSTTRMLAAVSEAMPTTPARSFVKQ